MLDKLRQPVPIQIKHEVVRLWLNGLQRDKIAATLGIGAGTVSHIISEWQEQIGMPTAEALREFSLELKGQNINPLQCAKGYRMLRQLNEAGISEAEVEPFVVRMHKKCISANISPSFIFDVCEQIFRLGDSVPICRLTDIIPKQVEEKRNLEHDITRLMEGKEKLQKEYSDAFNDRGLTLAALNNYKSTEKRLQRYGLSLWHDVEKIANVLDNLSRNGNDTEKILADLAQIRNYHQIVDDLTRQISNLQDASSKASQEHSAIEQKLDTARQRLAVYDDLQRHGIGLKDLKILRGKVLEIFAANADSGQIQNPYYAFRRFVEDVEEQYDVKLGFGGKIAEMERSLSEVKQQHHAILLEYSKLKNIYDNANELFDSGVAANDIIYWNNLIKRNRTDLSRLTQNLDQYGNLISVLDHLAAEVKSLRSEFSSLLTKVNELRGEEGRISHRLKYQLEDQNRAVQRFLKDVNDKISELKKASDQAFQSIKTESMLAVEQGRKKSELFLAEERQQLDLVQKIAASREFSPLVAAARREHVDGEALRAAVIRAMELMIS